MDQRCSRKITYLNFFLAVGIVVGHATNYTIYNLESFGGGIILLLIERINLIICGLGVPTFFVLSGYLFFRHFTLDKLPGKWRSRLHTLLIPYIFWNFIGYLYWYIINHIPWLHGRLNTSVDTEGLRALFRVFFMTESYNGTLWFLHDLIFIVLASPLIYFAICKRRIGVLVLIASVVAYFFINNPPDYYTSIILFAIGGYGGLHCTDIVEKRLGKRACITAIAVFCIICVYYYIAQYIMPDLHSGFLFIAKIIRAISLWIILDMIDWEKAHVPKAHGMINLSFYIYVTHSLILEVLQKMLLWGFKNTYGGAIIDYFLSPIITLAVIYISACALRKIPRFWHVITGGRG